MLKNKLLILPSGSAEVRKREEYQSSIPKMITQAECKADRV